MKVLILTDSLSLPRAGASETVYYEQTYPYLLKKKFPGVDFVVVGIGGGTIYDIIRQLDYYKVLIPDIFILQSGIVDCAPRIFKKWESKIIRTLRLSFLFKPFTRIIRKYRKLQYTKPSRFEQGCKRVREFYSGVDTQFHAIGILPASAEYEKKLPGITRNIKKYNDILYQQFEVVSTTDFDPVIDILGDHHHLNRSGHIKIFQRISLIIQAEHND